MNIDKIKLMNEEQKTLAEEIIKRHRECDGIFQWENLYYGEQPFFPSQWSDRKKADQMRYIRGILLEYELIEFLDEEQNLSRLTMTGNHFNTFKELEKREAEELEISKLSVEKLQLEVEDLRKKMFNLNTTLRQNKKLVIFAAISAIAAVVSAIITIFK